MGNLHEEETGSALKDCRKNRSFWAEEWNALRSAKRKWGRKLPPRTVGQAGIRDHSAWDTGAFDRDPEGWGRHCERNASTNQTIAWVTADWAPWVSSTHGGERQWSKHEHSSKKASAGFYPWPLCDLRPGILTFLRLSFLSCKGGIATAFTS